MCFQFCSGRNFHDLETGALGVFNFLINTECILFQDNEKDKWEPPMLRVNPIGEMSKVCICDIL